MNVHPELYLSNCLTMCIQKDITQDERSFLQNLLMKVKFMRNTEDSVS